MPPMSSRPAVVAAASLSQLLPGMAISRIYANAHAGVNQLSDELKQVLAKNPFCRTNSN
jgi:hypothetical protein